MKAKIKLIPFLLLAFIMLTANCCEKEDEQELPEITQTGEDTFGCLVDGEVWLPKAMLIYTPKHSVILERVDDVRIWDIVANRTTSSGFNFRIPEDFFEEGILNIPVDKDKDIGIFFDLEANYPSEHFSWDQDLSGELNISRYDTINKIISGIFWFDVMSGKGTKIEIREGRFDLTIDQIQP